jgi:hypothetical protein
MTNSAIIEAAARAVCSKTYTSAEARWYAYTDVAEAVLAAVTPLIKAEAFEEAAKMAEEYVYLSNRTVAAEIRALKEQP